MATLSLDKETIENRIQSLIDALVKSYEDYCKRQEFEYDPGYISFDVVKGTKYYKLVLNQGTGKSVHCFVHRQTGAVFKPASWNAPAKNVRYNLMDDVSFQSCLARANWSGSYLYQR